MAELHRPSAAPQSLPHADARADLKKPAPMPTAAASSRTSATTPSATPSSPTSPTTSAPATSSSTSSATPATPTSSPSPCRRALALHRRLASAIPPPPTSPSRSSSPSWPRKYGKSRQLRRRRTPARPDRVRLRHQRDRAPPLRPVHYLRHVGLEGPHQAGRPRLLPDLRPHAKTLPTPATTASTSAATASPSATSFRASPTPTRLLHRKHEPADDHRPTPTSSASAPKLTPSPSRTTGTPTASTPASAPTRSPACLYILPKVRPAQARLRQRPHRPRPSMTITSTPSSAPPTSSTATSAASPHHPPQIHRRRIAAAADDAKAPHSSSGCRSRQARRLTGRPRGSRATPTIPRQPRSRHRQSRRPSGYRLTDDTYATLLHRLAATPTQPIPPGVKEDILAYYANLPAFRHQKEACHQHRWAEVQHDLVRPARPAPCPPAPAPSRNFPTYGRGERHDDESHRNRTKSDIPPKFRNWPARRKRLSASPGRSAARYRNRSPNSRRGGSASGFGIPLFSTQMHPSELSSKVVSRRTLMAYSDKGC